MTQTERILVVDDEEIVRDVLSDLLRPQGYRVELAETGREAIDRIRANGFGLVLLDLKLPDIDGLAVLEELARVEGAPPVIMLTAFGTIEKAVRATQLGAFDFFEKPFKNDRVLLAVKNALEHRRLAAENARLKETLRKRYSFRNIIGKSAAMQQVFDLVAQVAPTRSTVLVQGESGTGKELVAKAIHAASNRADASFVAINCGSLPAELLESEMFGHVRGAYTGAVNAKKGLFEVADGGTLFLDEVATIGLEMQAKLLRVIQEREFRRLGGLENVRVDVRLIAATNTDLLSAVQAGAFREDLFYRLNVIAIRLPALRERPEDIALLAEHFMAKYSEENSKEVTRLDAAALKQLMNYPWPGNVRELENAIERAVVLAPGRIITPDLFPRRIAEGTPSPVASLSGDGLPLKDQVGNYERALILDALEKTEWNQKRAAQLLRVNATTLNEKMKRLKVPSRRAAPV